MTLKRLYERGQECEPTEDELIEKFYDLMQEETPRQFVFQCTWCKRRTKSSEVNDPATLFAQVTCKNVGEECWMESSVSRDVPLTKPKYVAGSYVSVVLDNGTVAPGMIDFVPDKHPEIEHTAFCDETAEEQKGHFVSFLSKFEEPFSSGWFPLHRITAIALDHEIRMETDKSLKKFRMCMNTRFSPLRDRLFKFSYMAHKHRLYPPKQYLSKYQPPRIDPVDTDEKEKGCAADFSNQIFRVFG